MEKAFGQVQLCFTAGGSLFRWKHFLHWLHLYLHGSIVGEKKLGFIVVVPSFCIALLFPETACLCLWPFFNGFCPTLEAVGNVFAQLVFAFVFLIAFDFSNGLCPTVEALGNVFAQPGNSLSLTF